MRNKINNVSIKTIEVKGSKYPIIINDGTPNIYCNGCHIEFGTSENIVEIKKGYCAHDNSDCVSNALTLLNRVKRSSRDSSTVQDAPDLVVSEAMG